MQNPKLIEMENFLKERIMRVEKFENLINVVVISPDQFQKYSIGAVFEVRTASTAKFV